MVVAREWKQPTYPSRGAVTWERLSLPCSYMRKEPVPRTLLDVMKGNEARRIGATQAEVAQNGE